MTMRRNMEKESDWITYGRCCLWTLGFCLVALPVFLWLKVPGEEWSQTPWWAFTLLALVSGFGIVCLWIGFRGKPETVKQWFESPNHDAYLVVMIIAAPLYFLLTAVLRKR